MIFSQYNKMNDDKSYYEICSRSHSYKAIVLEGEGMTRIHFGGTKKCVFIDVYDDHDVGHLDAVGHSPRCNMNGNLPRRDGTIDMVKSAILFMFKKFSTQESISLKDASNIICNNDKRVSLLHFYIAIYGKSWYQKYFEFKPEVLEHQEVLRRANRAMRRPIQESFDDFFQKNVEAAKLKRDIKQTIREVLEPIHKEIVEQKGSYRDFFLAIKDRHDCVVFYRWLRYYINSLCDLPFQEMFWILHKNDIPDTWKNIQIRRVRPFVFDMSGGDILRPDYHMPLGKSRVTHDILT